MTFKDLVKRGELFVHTSSGDMVVAFPILDVVKRSVRRESTGAMVTDITMELGGNASRHDGFHIGVSQFGQHLGLNRIIPQVGSTLYFKLSDHTKELNSLHDTVPLTFPNSIFNEKFHAYGTERPKPTSSRIF